MIKDRALSVTVIRKTEGNGIREKTESEKEENSLRTKMYHLQRRRRNDKEGKKLFGEGKLIVTTNQLGE